MSAMPVTYEMQARNDVVDDSLRMSSHRTVSIDRQTRSLAHRIAGRVRREFRASRWRRRLGKFGARSSIDGPAWCTGECSILIDDNVRIWRSARLDALNAALGVERINIGEGTVIHPYSHIGAIESVRIGCGVLIASHVFITDHDHDWSCPAEPVIRNRRAIASAVKIGDYAWLGERVMVLKGVHIGEHSIIGAGSIVTNDVPPYSMAVGSPARVVKRYDHNLQCWKGVGA